MRYLFGFLCVCALGAMPVVGCGEATPEWEDPCADIVCDDDETDCTSGYCEVGYDPSEGWGHASCVYDWEGDGSPCTYDGLSGVCVEGVCGEDPCEGVVCDDGDLCTRDRCRLDVGCIFSPICSDDDRCTEDTCDPDTGECSYPVLPDGTSCGCLESETRICMDFPLQFYFCRYCVDHGYCQNGECV